MLHVCNIKRFPTCCCIDQMLNFMENATYFLYKSHRSCQKHSNFGRETYEIFRKPSAFVPNDYKNEACTIWKKKRMTEALIILTPSFRDRLFKNHPFLKHPQSHAFPRTLMLKFLQICGVILSVLTQVMYTA